MLIQVSTLFTLESFLTHLVRQYHGKYYVPQNLCLVVAGKLPTNSLLDVLQTQVEPRIAEAKQNRGKRPHGWLRPFIETESANRPPFEKTIKQTIEFPDKEESMGEVQIAYRGSLEADVMTSQALNILGIYLTATPTSPLNKDLVEIPSPLW